MQFLRNRTFFKLIFLDQIMVEDCPVFYNIRDGPYYPALRILHQVDDSGKSALQLTILFRGRVTPYEMCCSGLRPTFSYAC